jgi:hypothetical protein
LRPAVCPRPTCRLIPQQSLPQLRKQALPA